MAEGAVAPGFAPVADAFDALMEETIGAGFAAIRDGETVVDICGGFSDRARTRVWTEDTLVPIYSATKPIAAFVLARACERAGVRLDAPVASVWPEFAANGKDRVTIAEALAHQAGVAGFVEPIDPALWLDPAACAAAIAQLAPMWPPGTRSGYHPLTWGYIAGELAHRLDGRSLGTQLREDICGPRQIDFHIGLADAQHGRCAEMRRPPKLPDLGPLTPLKRAAFLEKWSAPDRGGAVWRRIEIPSANGHGTARAAASLFALYATGGDGLISGKTFEALTAPRAYGEDLILPFTLDWRAGVLGNNLGFFGPKESALGHYGWGGAMGGADAGEGLSFAFVTNTQSHHLMGDPRARALIDALYACL
jgi:CubicO group peptidase (beta-lactamase class C family)